MKGSARQLQSLETKEAFFCIQLANAFECFYKNLLFPLYGWKVASICFFPLNYTFTSAALRRGWTTSSVVSWACGPQGEQKWFSKHVPLCLCCSLGQYLFGGLSVKCLGSDGPFWTRRANPCSVFFFFFRLERHWIEFYKTTLYRPDTSPCVGCRYRNRNVVEPVIWIRPTPSFLLSLQKTNHLFLNSTAMFYKQHLNLITK